MPRAPQSSALLAGRPARELRVLAISVSRARFTPTSRPISTRDTCGHRIQPVGAVCQTKASAAVKSGAGAGGGPDAPAPRRCAQRVSRHALSLPSSSSSMSSTHRPSARRFGLALLLDPARSGRSTPRRADRPPRTGSAGTSHRAGSTSAATHQDRHDRVFAHRFQTAWTTSPALPISVSSTGSWKHSPKAMMNLVSEIFLHRPLEGDHARQARSTPRAPVVGIGGHGLLEVQEEVEGDRQDDIIGKGRAQQEHDRRGDAGRAGRRSFPTCKAPAPRSATSGSRSPERPAQSPPSARCGWRRRKPSCSLIRISRNPDRARPGVADRMGQEVEDRVPDREAGDHRHQKRQKRISGSACAVPPDARSAGPSCRRSRRAFMRRPWPGGVGGGGALGRGGGSRGGALGGLRLGQRSAAGPSGAAGAAVAAAASAAACCGRGCEAAVAARRAWWSSSDPRLRTCGRRP
jgi:hypothetical protein